MIASPASAAPTLAALLGGTVQGSDDAPATTDSTPIDPTAKVTGQPWDFLGLLQLLQAPLDPTDVPLSPLADATSTDSKPTDKDKTRVDSLAAMTGALSAPLVLSPLPNDLPKSPAAGPALNSTSHVVVTTTLTFSKPAMLGTELLTPPSLSAATADMLSAQSPAMLTPKTAVPAVAALTGATHADLPATVAKAPTGLTTPPIVPHNPNVPAIAPDAAPTTLTTQHIVRGVTIAPTVTDVMAASVSKHVESSPIATWQMLMPQDVTPEQTAPPIPLTIAKPADEDHVGNDRGAGQQNADISPMHASLLAGAPSAHDAGSAPTSARTDAAPSDAPLFHAAPTAEGIAEGLRSRLDELRNTGRVDLHLELNPPELGRVRVQLAAHDHQISLQMTVEGDSARHAIENQADALRHRLGELGIALGRFDVRRDGAGSSFAGQHGPPPEPPAPPTAAPTGRRRTAPAVPALSAIRAGIDLIA